MNAFICVFLILFSSCSSKYNELDSRINTDLSGVISDAKHPKRKIGYKAFSEIANNSIKSLKMSIDKEKGELLISFDFEPYIWLDTAFPQGDTLLVRIFDKNGQYLTHFETADIFLPEKALNIAQSKDFPSVIHSCSKTKRTTDYCKIYHCNSLKNCLLIKKKNNQISYSVNQSISNYAAIAEIGFVERKNGYTAMNIPWTCSPEQSCLGLYDPKWFKDQSVLELTNNKSDKSKRKL